MNAFNTPFRHRINAGMDGEFFNLVDTINPSLERAAAIADLLDMAIETGETDGLKGNTLWLVARAIHLEIRDAQILLEAYYQREREGAHEQHN